MNVAQARFAQIFLIVVAVLLFFAAWKPLPPDTFWLPYSYRIVMNASSGHAYGLESNFKNLGASITIGFIAPVICLAVAAFLRLGKSR